MYKNRPRSGSELKRPATHKILKKPVAQKDLPKGATELALPAGEVELDLPAPKRTKRLSAPKIKRSWTTWLKGTKYYLLEYALTCWLLVSLLVVTYYAVFYLADLWSTTGSPPSRSSSLMLAFLIYAAVDVLLLTVLLKRTLAEEAKHPKLINSPGRLGLFEATFRFAILGAIGFGLATIYLLVSSPFQVGKWSHTGFYAAGAAMLAGLHTCLIYALPRLPDEENTRSLMELAVAVPCVVLIGLAFSLNTKPAKVIDTDHQSLKDLITLQQAISHQYQTSQKLPSKFADVLATQSAGLQARAKLHNYNYLPISSFAQRILGQQSNSSESRLGATVFYLLCANFQIATLHSDTVPNSSAIAEQMLYQKTHPLSVKSEHPAGDYCYLIVEK